MLENTDPSSLVQPSESSHDHSSSDIPHLLFVHGTGAGADSDTGERWWQHDSPFREELSQRLDLDPARVVVRSHRWGKGPNLESERRLAGQALLAELRKLEEAGTDYYLVGHSHGGSVIYSALLEAMRQGKPLKRLKLWCTVGTPFLDYQANRWLFQRLSQFELTIFVACLLAFLFAACALVIAFTDSQTWDSAVESIELFLFFVISGVIGLWLVYRLDRRKRSWFSRRQKMALAQEYGDRWVGLYHREDEAISLLENIRHLDEPIIPKNFLEPFAAAIQLGAFAIFGLVIAFIVIFEEDESAPAEPYEPYSLILNSEGVLELIFTSFFFIGLILLGFGLFLLIVYLIGKALNFLASLAGPPLSRFLNKLIWSNIQKKSWGDDLVKEDVGATSPHPPELRDRFGPLPEIISDPLSLHADNNAIRAIQKVRVVLGMSEERRKSSRLTTQLAETLVWEELIHTSYFRVPEFTDLLAMALSDAGLSGRKDGFALGPEGRADLQNWLREAQSKRFTEKKLAEAALN